MKDILPYEPRVLAKAGSGITSFIFLVLILGILLVSKTAAAEDYSEYANRLFSRLTGVPLPLNDSRRPEIERLLRENRWMEAAHIATADDRFFNVTVRNFATEISNRDHDPLAGMNDFIAAVIGQVRDERDARELLYGDFRYQGDPNKIPNLPALEPNNNNHYAFLDTNFINLRQNLLRVEPQRDDIEDAAGLLTTRAWGQAHLDAGTNRRAVEYAFLEFMCTPIKTLADPTVPDNHIRRDVDRAPGGSASTFVNSCRGCHAGLDSLGGAYAFFEFTNGTVIYSAPTVQGKMNKNGSVYAPGFITTNDSWNNPWTQNQNASFGWRGSLSGNGVSAFGYMLANSEGFATCMVRRVFRKMCRREEYASDEYTIRELTEAFMSTGFNMRLLFESAAVQPQCLAR